MMNASAISKFATKTNILLLFLAIILFSFVIFPMFESFNEGVRLKILDARFSYTQNDVIELFTQMKPEGRSNYFKMIVLIDMVYPLFYGAFLMLLTTFTLKNIFDSKTSWNYLVFMPLIAVFFDYLENVNTIVMLIYYPEISLFLTSLGSSFTSMKWSILSMLVLILLLFLIFMGFKSVIKNVNK